MSESILAPPPSTHDPSHVDRRQAVRDELRGRVLRLEHRINEAHDELLRAGAELDALVRERNRLIFRLEHFGGDED